MAGTRNRSISKNIIQTPQKYTTILKHERLKAMFRKLADKLAGEKVMFGKN